MGHFEGDDREGLAGALVGDRGRAQAKAALARAEALGVEGMDCLAALCPNDPETPYRNAARLLGVAYGTRIGRLLDPLAPEAQIEALGGVRTARGRHGDRDVLFVSPGFAPIAALAGHLASAPHLRTQVCLVSPATLQAGLAWANRAALATHAIQALARRFPVASAHLDLPFSLRLGFVALLIVAIAFSILPLAGLQAISIAVVTIVLAAPSIFRIWAALTFTRNRPLSPKRLLGEAELPVYTVMIPLRNEAHMVPQIARAMRRLDYPAEKLEIMLVVESASVKTVAAARRQLNDPRFRLIVVPHSAPHTKPKALNYALPFARGAHVVVFDAEDIPEPGQLRKAASLLAEDPTLECLQAELVIANCGRNWLTRMFAAEYAGHFGVLLPALGRAGFPVPLGGTSNHFRTETLRRIGGWDAFNVTEDADLGIRMARLGLRVDIVASRTFEEAPERARDWVRQRSRWIKGWMQTLLVHCRRPRLLLTDLGARRLAAFLVFVGGMVLALALHGLFLVVTVLRLAADLISLTAPDLWTLAGLASLVLGYCGAAAVGVIGLERIGRRDMTGALFGLPAYWLLAWGAVCLAARDLVIRPFHWAKTTHKGAVAQAGAPDRSAAPAIGAPSPARG